MDKLPVELIRLIYDHCDVPSVRALRLVSPTFADVGYDYLVDLHFTACEWRDDVDRLRCIANHPRLRHSIRSITFAVSKDDPSDALRARLASQPSSPQQLRRSSDEQLAARFRQGANLSDDHHSSDAETDEDDEPWPSIRLTPFHTKTAALKSALAKLPNLRHVAITLSSAPHEPILFRKLGCAGARPFCRRPRDQIRASLSAVAAALCSVSQSLASLSINPLPLEILRHQEERKAWLDLAESKTVSSLTRLALVIDHAPTQLPPRGRLCAVASLGHLIQRCGSSGTLTHLTLAFRAADAPRAKFNLDFSELFPLSSPTTADSTSSAFSFPSLTSLHIEGASCSEPDLRSFLLRHAPTLEKVRLGGRGCVRSPAERSVGGVHLHEGTFRGLFSALQGRLPRLRRFTMEGDMEAGRLLRAGAGAREVFYFSPGANNESEDEEEEGIPASGEGLGSTISSTSSSRRQSASSTASGTSSASTGTSEASSTSSAIASVASSSGLTSRPASPCIEAVDSSVVERFLIHGGEYPLVANRPAAVPPQAGAM